MLLEKKRKKKQICTNTFKSKLAVEMSRFSVAASRIAGGSVFTGRNGNHKSSPVYHVDAYRGEYRISVDQPAPAATPVKQGPITVASVLVHCAHL